MEPEQAKQLNESMAQVLDWLKDTAEKGESFVMEQAPAVCQEIVAWEFWSNALAVVACLVGIAVSAVVARRWGYWCASLDYEQQNSYGPPVFIVAALSAVASLVLIIPLWFSTGNAVKACVAPRLVIIEKVAGLLK
jgi:hypothetical protein